MCFEWNQTHCISLFSWCLWFVGSVLRIYSSIYFQGSLVSFLQNKRETTLFPLISGPNCFRIWGCHQFLMFYATGNSMPASKLSFSLHWGWGSSFILCPFLYNEVSCDDLYLLRCKQTCSLPTHTVVFLYGDPCLLAQNNCKHRRLLLNASFLRSILFLWYDVMPSLFLLSLSNHI